jgi:hypothetical protein
MPYPPLSDHKNEESEPESEPQPEPANSKDQEVIHIKEQDSKRWRPRGFHPHASAYN